MSLRPSFRRAVAVAAAAAAAAATLFPARATAAPPAGAACGIQATAPAWIDYADALRTDVRDVFARPGVVVSSSGTAVPAYFRAHGAATTYFALHLPALVGEPAEPADPATIPAAAARLAAQATASTGCATPWIALNELFGSNLPAPWSPTNTQYRANVLALMQALAAAGARPVLLVHGDYTVAGATADWWRQVAQSGEIVYEAYYNAAHISELGPLIGNRRMRVGIRSFVSHFKAIGVLPAQLGVMLGFHAGLAAGAGGRQGLEPREAWLRVVKWEALAARQVATETGLNSIWSWGWASFSGSDPDRAAAACVYLWARDAGLCDGPAAGGVAFNPSLVEGQIVLAPGVQCSLPGDRIRTRTVRRLAVFTRDAHAALTALAGRESLRTAVRVTDAEVRAVERRAVARVFRGNRRMYLRALARRHATVGIARGVIRDELRRRAIAAMLRRSGGETTLEWTNDRESRAADNLICRRDDLPGSGDFPASDRLDLGVVPLPALLPFLFGDRRAPAAPSVPAATVATGAVTLTWPYGSEPDLAGYELFRATSTGGTYARLGAGLLARPTYVDRTPSIDSSFSYVVRAVDTSGNVSGPSPPVSPGAAPARRR